MNQSANNTNYFGFQNIPNMYDNQNAGINNIILMTMAPIISTLFATIFQTFIQDLKTGIYNIFSFIYKQLSHYTNHYILFKLDTYNKIYITMYQKTMDYNGVGDNISTEALPIIWYLNNVTMLKNNKLKIAKMINYSEMLKKRQLIFSGMGMNSGIGNTKLNNRINEKIVFAPFPEKNSGQNVQPISSNRQIDSINNINIPTIQKEENMESIEIADNIFLDIKTELLNSNYTRETTETYLIIKSDKLSLYELKNFVIKITRDYESLFELKKDKIYVYNGSDKIPQYGCYDLDKYQSFDNLFFSEKENILKDLKKFTSNTDYYVKHGIKRKIGYLLHGLPGSGKTAIASAISRSLNRTPVYVPISRIQTNYELENILYIRKYNDTYFNTNETIILLDELDSGRKEQKMIKKIKKDKNDKIIENNHDSDFESDNDSKDNNVFNPTIVINNGNDKKDNNDTQIIKNDTIDEFNVGILLSMLDGNIDQNELVIIATTNDISKLDPAIYRDGRLKLIKIDYVGKIEIVQMIEHYYDIKLTDNQKELICDNKTVPSLTVKNVCLQFVNDDSFDINILIDKINDLYININKNDIEKLSHNKKFPLLPPQNKIKMFNGQRPMSNFYGSSMDSGSMNIDAINIITSMDVNMSLD
jgi:hypothetical protein